MCSENDDKNKGNGIFFALIKIEKFDIIYLKKEVSRKEFDGNIYKITHVQRR